MKSTGINRPVDELGRIVFPVELRRTLDLYEGDSVEFFYDDESKSMMLRKYRSQACLFCGSMEELTYFRNQFICASCRLEIRSGFISDDAAAPVGISEEPDNQTMEEPKHQTIRRSERKRKVDYKDLMEVMTSHPEVTQKIWADMLGISQSRVSQMIREHQMRDPKAESSGNESLTAMKDDDIPVKKKGRGKRAEVLQQLKETMRTYPNASQSEWARILGFSQGYVSQLIRDINKADQP